MKEIFTDHDILGGCGESGIKMNAKMGAKTFMTHKVKAQYLKLKSLVDTSI